MRVNNFGITNELAISPIQVGQLAPYFSGMDQHGDFISSDRLLVNGPYIVLFYRGYWCNHCQEYLTDFQQKLTELDDEGVQVVAITPEQRKYVIKTVHQSKIEFPIIYDEFSYIMEAFGVSYKTALTHQKVGQGINKIDVKKVNDQDYAVLPIPASFVVNAKNEIDYVHFDLDVTKRARFDDLVARVYGIAI